MFTATEIPTHFELRAFIQKIAEFLKNFLQIFDQLKAGLAETFGDYKKQEWPTYEAAAEEEAE